MRSTTLFIAALAVAAGRVVAQDDPTTDTNDIPECITTCTMESASQAGCTSMCAQIVLVSLSFPATHCLVLFFSLRLMQGRPHLSLYL